MYLIDANENTVASYEYDPYGNIVSASGTMAEINPLRYRGYYYDAELDMYYLQSRYYDPQVGRFINADACTYPDLGFLGYNLFVYCGNNPVCNVDYSGESWLTALFSSGGSSKSSTNVVQYDVPLYKQGNYSLCWAFCQVMIESWTIKTTLSSWGATNRAKEIAKGLYGKSNWNRGGWPTNTDRSKDKRYIYSISDLYYLVRGRGPVYAYYNNGKTGSEACAHLVVVTGVDLDKGFVYTNNPWGVKGKQTFQQFKNGVAKKWYQSGMGMKFQYVLLVNY